MRKAAPKDGQFKPFGAFSGPYGVELDMTQTDYADLVADARRIAAGFPIGEIWWTLSALADAVDALRAELDGKS